MHSSECCHYVSWLPTFSKYYSTTLTFDKLWVLLPFYFIIPMIYCKFALWISYFAKPLHDWCRLICMFPFRTFWHSWGRYLIWLLISKEPRGNFTLKPTMSWSPGSTMKNYSNKEPKRSGSFSTNLYVFPVGFHRTFAIGAASQQKTLTPPDTWSCPIWDLHLF